ncbi:571_t:CDS:2, partial [Gigaspora margarita]
LIEAYLENVRAIEDDIAEQNATENVEIVIVATTTQEKNSKKHGQYTCGLCKQPGYNIATCPYK